MRKHFPLLAVLAFLFATLALPAFAQAASVSAPSPGAGIFGALWPLLLAAAPAVVPIVSGPFNALFTEMLAKLPIPFNKETTLGLIAALTAVSATTTLLCNLVIAWLSGQPASFDVAHASTVVAEIVASVTAAGGYFGFWKKATT